MKIIASEKLEHSESSSENFEKQFYEFLQVLYDKFMCRFPSNNDLRLLYAHFNNDCLGFKFRALTEMNQMEKYGIR